MGEDVYITMPALGYKAAPCTFCTGNRPGVFEEVFSGFIAVVLMTERRGC